MTAQDTNPDEAVDVGRVLLVDPDAAHARAVGRVLRAATTNLEVVGAPAEGEPINWLGCDVWTFRDGLVVKKDTYWKYIDP